MNTIRHNGNSHGFTLIELLVVIAIIAILAAILFPVFAKARLQAQKASCLSNMKQIALGFMMYADDYDGCFMINGYHWWGMGSAAYPSLWGNALPSWSDDVYPYVGNMKMFACPARPNEGVGLSVFGGFPQTYSRGYGPNWETLSGMAHASEANIVDPSNSILVEESIEQWTYQGGPGDIDKPCMAEVKGHLPNWAFCDGHAKSMRVAQTISPVNMWNATQTYPQTLTFDWAVNGSATVTVHDVQELQSAQNSIFAIQGFAGL